MLYPVFHNYDGYNVPESPSKTSKTYLTSKKTKIETHNVYWVVSHETLLSKTKLLTKLNYSEYQSQDIVSVLKTLTSRFM